MKTTPILLLAALGLVTAASCTTTDPNSFCGDGTRDSTEQCDDGNNIDGDGCAAACLIEIPEGCGDGVVDGAEACDDGGESVACDIDCTARECGDAIRNVTAGEACDDGNTENGDGCSDDCHLEIPNTCGDGEVSSEETCDDGMETPTCDVDCTEVVCGDGHANAAAEEGCDDGNTADGDGCSATCQVETQPCGLDPIECGSMVFGSTDEAGSTSDYDSYTCLPDADKSGPERVFEWIADRNGTINVFNEGAAAVDIIVHEAQPDCGLGTCLAGGHSGAQFEATMGNRYLIVVDTDAGPGANYYVGLICP